MDIKTIQNKMSELEAYAIDLGFREPRAIFHVNWVTEGYYLELRLDAHDARFGERGDDVPMLFKQASDWLEAQENPLALRKKEFVRNLGNLLDEARELDMPIIPDLEATMKRLSHNILEHRT